MDFKYLKRGTKYTMSDPKDDEKMAAGVDDDSDSDSDCSSESVNDCDECPTIPCYDCCEEVLDDDTVYFDAGGRCVCLECWADRYTCKKKECLDSRNCYCEDAYRMA